MGQYGGQGQATAADYEGFAGGLTPQQIMEYMGRDDLSAEEIAMADIDKSGTVDMQDAIQSLQVQSGLRDPRNLQGINPWLQQYQRKSDMPDFSQYAMKSDIQDFTPFDPSGLQGRLAALEGMQPATSFDPSGLQTRIAELEAQLAGFQGSTQPTQFDPSGLQSRLAALEGKSYGGPSMADIEALINQRFSSQSPADNPYAPSGPAFPRYQRSGPGW
jgi:hypothetical protein